MPVNNCRPMSAKELKKLYGGKTRMEALDRMAKKISSYLTDIREAFEESLRPQTLVDPRLIEWEVFPYQFGTQPHPHQLTDENKEVT